MRLFTHNMLQCNAKGVTMGYPLAIEASETEVLETEYNPDFVRNLVPKLEWSALVAAATGLGIAGLPEEISDELLADDAVVRALHHALMEVNVLAGALICPESGRRFPIVNGIPNMLLNEDEV